MKIILLCLILHTLFYRRSNNLSCGLFGYVGADAPNFDWIKILGMGNQKRGEDSFGILMGDGEIEKTLGKFTDFMAKNNIDYDKLKNYKDHTIIGHVRQKSVGVVSLDNCHPFDVKNKDGKTILILAHNGTIKYHNELLKRYKIPDTGINIDSQAIAHILAKDPKNVSVLTEYKGAGAFVMWNPKKKNTLYVFKGASKEYTNSKVTEERPLFYYTTENKGIYYSSERDALYILGGNDENVKEFPTNKLLEVKDGEINVIKELDRSEVDNVGAWYPWEDRGYKNKSKTNVALAYELEDYHKVEDEKGSFITGSANNTNGIQIINKKNGRAKLTGPSKKSSTDSSVNSLLIQEAPYFDQNIHGSRVYFWRGKYYRNGHIINKQESGKETICEMLTLDNNGYNDLHPLCNMNRLEDIYFWDGIIIEPANVVKVNELALQHKLFKNDTNNGAVLDTFTLSNLTNCLVSNPSAWYHDVKLNGSFANCTYKARFGCPIVHTFTVGRLVHTDNSLLAEYNKPAKKEVVGKKTEEEPTVDEPVTDVSLDDGMLKPVDETDKKLDVELCYSTFIDAKEEFFRASEEIRKFANEYPEAKIMWIRMVSEVRYLEEFLDKAAKGRVGFNEEEYNSMKDYCEKRNNNTEIVKV